MAWAILSGEIAAKYRLTRTIVTGPPKVPDNLRQMETGMKKEYTATVRKAKLCSNYCKAPRLGQSRLL